MTTVAYLAVSPEGRTHRQQIWLRDEAVPGLRRLTDAVHAEGAAVAAQIGHAGPVANAASNRSVAIAPGKAFSPLVFRMARAATEADLERIVTAHADAARLAVESGFDALEVHCGHNYLVSAFLSPRLNRRDDRHGGSLANRARLALDVTRAVRDAVGDRVAITAKLNMSDGVRGGLGLDESLQVAAWLERDGTVDALELTAGSSLLNPMYLFTGDAPVREFAAAFPAAPAVWAAAGRAGFPSAVPVPRGVPPAEGTPVPGGTAPAADPARRHHPPRDHGGRGGGRVRVRGHGPRPAA